MQPRTLALLVSILPLLAANAAYLISANAGHVPWCVPYIDGCTSISRAARHGDALFVFRALMMFYAVVLIWYWWIVRLWLNQLDRHTTGIAQIIYWLGIVGALSLVVYIDFLGSSGTVYRFMRRYGVIVYFSFTPLAHLLMINHIQKLKIKQPGTVVSANVLRYQTVIVMLIVILGLSNVTMTYTGARTDQTENIIEWNYALLMTLFFASSFFMWKDFKLELMSNSN